jgi:peptidoglycan/LPS O-acetylase OafA/YrhL
VRAVFVESRSLMDSKRPDARTGQEHFVFLDYLRAMAAWAVVWDHVGSWPERYGVKLHLVGVVRRYFNQPFGVIQDFGWLAVSIFFLISGFVISHVSDRENVAEFLIKRLFKIYPLVALFVLLAIAFDPAVPRHLEIADVLRNMTVLNFYVVPEVVTVGVAWTLAIELLFYALTASTMWISRPRVIIAINMLVPLVFIMTRGMFGPDYFLVAVNMSYIPFLVVGQAFYFGFYKRILSLGEMALIVAGCFVILLYGISKISPEFLPTDNSYLINFIYACGIFYMVWKLNPRLHRGRTIRFLASSSFAVYLTHGVLGFAAFSFLHPHYGMRVAVAGAVAVTAVGASAIHLFIERPLLRLGRRIANLTRRAPPGGMVKTDPARGGGRRITRAPW